MKANMESNKRTFSEIDPDYIFPDNAKISRISECQTNSDKLAEIVKREFNAEVLHKERELEEIEDRLKVAMKTLQLLRSVCVSTYYNRNELVLNSFTDADLKLNDSNVDTIFGPQTRPHPAVRKIIGKVPLQIVPSRTRQKNSTQINLKKELNTCTEEVEDVENESKSEEDAQSIPNETISHENLDSIARNERFKTKFRIIIGNISKWLLQSGMSQDKSTHKWMVYVRGPVGGPDVASIIKKVRFFLHPSYRPNDIIEIKNSPFHLSRRGWGEFPLRVQIHFSNGVNKPIDVIHNLKLTTSRTGLETLGAETSIDVWLYTEPLNKIKLFTRKVDTQVVDIEYVNLYDDEETVKTDCQEEISTPLPSETILKSETCSETNVNIIEDNLKSDISNAQSFSDTPNTPLNPTISSNDTPDKKIYVKDGKICVFKNKSRTLNKSKNKISLLKSCVSKQLNDNCVITLVTVRTLDEIHNYCKKFDEDSNTSEYYTKFLINFTNSKFYGVTQALYYLLRYLPLFSEHANDFLYLQKFSYVAKTMEEFLTWNKTKQFCAEWYRAKYIKSLLIKHNINGHENWSTKSIVQFSRLAGFGINNENTIANKCLPNNRHTDDYTLRTYAESIELQNWLRNQANHSVRECISNETEINVVDVESPVKENNVQENRLNPINIHEFSENDLPKYLQNNYVKEIVSDLGIKFDLEEIVPNSWAPLSELCVLVATKCFAEDLIRRSLVSSSKQCDNRKEIALTDVKSALQSRAEFDLFSNYGLGKKIF